MKGIIKHNTTEVNIDGEDKYLISCFSCKKNSVVSPEEYAEMVDVGYSKKCQCYDPEEWVGMYVGHCRVKDVLPRSQRPTRASAQSEKYWVLECKCGNERHCRSQDIRKALTLDNPQLSCGCQVKNKPVQAGAKVGRLTVLSVVPMEDRKPTERGQVWLCECDCGRPYRAMARKVVRRKNASCGVCRYDDDYAGQQFNDLTAVRKINRKEWRCKCTCGKEVTRPASFLRDGRDTVCYHESPHGPITEGARFGELLALKRVPKHNGRRWTFLCSCGTLADLSLQGREVLRCSPHCTIGVKDDHGSK